MRTRNKPAMRGDPNVISLPIKGRPSAFLSMTELDASLFYWENGVGKEAASTVGFQACEQIDARDVGICLRNKKTGLICRFYLTKIDKNADGDVRFWKFLPIPEDAKRFPKAAGVIIWND